MHEVLVNRLGGLSLPKKSVVSLTDRPDMTLDVYRGSKTTVQQQQQRIFTAKISAFDLVFTRCILVTPCCYHKISPYNHVYTRCFLVISYFTTKFQLSILYLQDAFSLFRVVITKYHLSVTFLVKTGLLFFIPDPITLP